MWTVYMHICPNKKVYIGITSVTPETRWRQGGGYPNNPHFTNAIQKYGWDNIEHLILFENLEEENAKNIEIKLISVWKSVDMCYNLTDGGDGYKGLQHDDAFCERLAERSKGNKWGAMKTKPVLQINKDTGEVIQEFTSAREAWRITGVHWKLISNAIKRGTNSGGYKWEFKHKDGKYVYNPKPNLNESDKDIPEN